MFAQIRRIWSYGKRISTAFESHFGGLMAAAIAFYALLSLIPLLSVGIAILSGAVGDSDRALADFQQALKPYLPTAADIVARTLAETRRDPGLLGLFGLVGLLVSGSAVFTNMEIAFNNIWGVKTMRNWWMQRLVAIGTALLTLALMLASIAITSLLTFVQHARVPGLGLRAEEIPFLWQILGDLLPPSLAVAMFALLYRIVPNRPIRWRAAFLGGLFAGAAWGLAQYLFALYLAQFSSYNQVYGSLGGIVILIVWTYYSATILCLGAEIAADYDLPVIASARTLSADPGAQGR